MSDWRTTVQSSFPNLESADQQPETLRDPFLAEV
jgi:hypothetical protein